MMALGATALSILFCFSFRAAAAAAERKLQDSTSTTPSWREPAAKYELENMRRGQRVAAVLSILCFAALVAAVIAQFI